MTVPATKDIDAVPDIPLSLEAVELELALQAAEAEEFDKALHGAGARLLFGVHPATGTAQPYVAAVVVGDGADRQFLIVTRPAEGAVSVETAETSKSPLARLAPSFAAVMERWPLPA
ncbi:MAG: hypothetical protein KF849_01360 [Rhizobiaceae bacterium]|nr:hypothetical protein [Rhizobiaceae bacterium]